MPDQVVDLPVASSRNLKSFSRFSRTENPSVRFQEVMKHRSGTDLTRTVAKRSEDRTPAEPQTAPTSNSPKQETEKLGTSSDNSVQAEESASEQTEKSDPKVRDSTTETVSKDPVPDPESDIQNDSKPQSHSTSADAASDQTELLLISPSPSASGSSVQPTTIDSINEQLDTVPTSTDIEMTEMTSAGGKTVHSPVHKMSLMSKSTSTVSNTIPTTTERVSATDLQSEVGVSPPKSAGQTSTATSEEWIIQGMSPVQDDDSSLAVQVLSDTDTDAGLSMTPAATAPKQMLENAKSVHVPLSTPTPEDRFVEQNVDRIITGIKSDLTPNGGTMKIRLDPPNLGQLQIDVSVDEGTLTASFQTSNEEATRLLSHSMQQLKHSLEAAGVNVDRIQVRQTSESSSSNSTRSGDQDSSSHQQSPEDHSHRQEQQRRDFLQKMWEKLALGQEPLDLVV
ncbi:MAG: hypothetical protein KatS3mg104_1347 [Phycisphaerae bacterium]|jgi:flagellar hook-length control protein FliK|nr:MAG: hypothetical protein KatS3mg104_1347 [Phycisphaerae bacterium]